MPSVFPASYRPDESSADIFAEHTWLQGAFLGVLAYGIEFNLYVMTCYFLWKLQRPTTKKKNIVFINYISIIFVLSTFYIAGLLEFTQESFIDGRNIPGGPAAFETVMFSLPIDMLANASMVISSWLCDLVNLWRCFVIYKGCRVSAWIVNIVPIVLYLGSVAFGIPFLKQIGTVSQSPWDSSGFNFTIPYYAMSLALNVLVTILIVIRLMIYRHRIVQAMGPGQGNQYTSLAAMIVESAGIYSAYSLCFLIPFVLNSSVSQLFIQGLPLVQGVTTFLIIFRVATGKSWSNDTYPQTFQTTCADVATRTFTDEPISKKYTSPDSSNVLSSCERGSSSPSDEPTMKLSPIASSSDWLSAKKSVGNMEKKKYVEGGSSLHPSYL